MRSPPVALTIAGSDCSSGAGAQADLKTFTALGVYGLTAITCVVAETPGKVTQIQPVDAEVVEEQMTLLLDAFPVGAIKTGMLFSAEIVALVARLLRDRGIPVVVDPVMVATSGDLLLKREAVAVYERDLFPRAALITPNLDEAATLLGRRIPGLAAMRIAGQELARRYNVPVLLKGGHLQGENAVDLLCTTRGVREFSAKFDHEVYTHGTGCTYSAAIAAALASGLPLEEAVERGKRFVTAAITQHFEWTG
ncbi:MAG TPA: bifunctional hydroxymethylpyrimidine kinase/phosphomethylpyrimidine kinase, partial [Chthoniobacterales bacterium]|nr:bifunctional hydroxymethylpyrimidine kinase/phosphomethylpyrimidine kinase [Chthoniobacterales bacterium]